MGFLELDSLAVYASIRRDNDVLFYGPQQGSV